MANPVAPWYKHPWPWLFMAPIIAAMIMGFFYLNLAIKQQALDPPLSRESIRDGRGYSIDPAYTEQAALLNMRAELTFDDLTGEVIVHLQGDWPDDVTQLELHLLVGAAVQNDAVITLNRIGHLPQFNGQLSQQIHARTTLLLMDPVNGWKLRKSVQPPFTNTVIEMKP